MTSTSTIEKEERKEALRKQFIEQNNDYIILKSKEDLDNLKIEKFNTWIMDGDGVYLTVKNRIGEFTARVQERKVPGLPSLMREQYKMSLPRVPMEIYNQVQAFFYDIADEMGNAEAYVQIYYDLKEGKYLIHVPKQQVSGASVKYDNEENLSVKDVDRYIWVLEIHSHNTMNAFFSGVDDADEKETRFYGVFGKIKDPVPDFKLRFVIHDQKLIVRAQDVFDMGHHSEYPKEWKDNVKRMGQPTGAKSIDGYSGYNRHWGYGNWEWDNDEIAEYYKRQYGTQDPKEFKSQQKSQPSTQESIKNKIAKNYQNGIPGHVRSHIEEWTKNYPEVQEDKKQSFIPPEKQQSGTWIDKRLADGSTDLPEDNESDEIPHWLKRYRNSAADDGPLDDEEDMADSEQEMQEALENLNNTGVSEFEERWAIIGDFVESLRDYDISSLCEHLTTYGLVPEVVRELRNAA